MLHPQLRHLRGDVMPADERVITGHRPTGAAHGSAGKGEQEAVVGAGQVLHLELVDHRRAGTRILRFRRGRAGGFRIGAQIWTSP